MPLINIRHAVPAFLEAGETVKPCTGYGGGADRFTLHTTDHGLCISDREMNGRDDSDFYMTVWNPETASATEVCFATTRGWSYPAMGSSPDALPSVMFAYGVWTETQRRIWDAKRTLAAMEAPHEGAVVEVYKGRKVPKGTRGTVLSARDETVHVSRYGTWKTTRTMLFIAVEGKNATLHVDADNCKVVAQSPALIQKVFDIAG
jgi:hypothetical protein